MLALDAKIEQITEADQGALQKPQDQEDKVSSKINLMELQMFKSVVPFSDTVTLSMATRTIPPIQMESVE